MTSNGDGRNRRLLYSSERTRVTRVLRGDGSWVIRKEALGAGGVRRLRREADLLRRLRDVEGVPRLVEVDQAGGAIVLADAGGRALADAVAGGACDPVWVAGFARDLALVVAGVHRAGVVHKDINPANVLVQPDGDRPVLIDFDLATTFAVERPLFTHHSQIAGTLGYLAPEQTGRTGRAVDQRADLYALGATLYELTTGRTPFAELVDDPLRLVHAHLATVPAAPDRLNPAVPPALSAIVMRLLAKEPDQRYQSAEGLAHDLELLLTRLDASDGDEFPLGTSDFPAQLSPPSRLVGRDEELVRLREAYRKVRDGRAGAGALLVAGAPGVGKSALLDELRPLVTEDGGWFVTGRFDQFRQDPEGDGVRQALAGLGRLLLAEPDTAAERHRQRLLAALGPNAGWIADGFPEYRALLGVPPERPEGESEAVTARLVRAGVDLLATVASPSRPVVVVLDDLQWAPAFPIRLVDAVLTDPRVRGLLVVGAYRDGDVDAAHPLTETLARWERLHVSDAPLRLVNLPPGDLSVLLAEMLRIAPDRTRSLAEAIGARTGGNPYDTVELVNAMRRDGVVVHDVGGWRWDPDDLRRFVGAGDVSDLLATRINQLPAGTVDVLQTMACLGGDTDLELLAVATGLTTEELREQLTPALEEGLLLAAHADPDEPYSTVRFRYDRVQQAAHAHGQPHLLTRRHLSIARRLAATADQPDGKHGALAGEHYLHAIDEVTEPDEVRRAAALLVTAASGMRLTNPSGADRCLSAGVTALTRIGAGADEILAVQRVHHGVLIACSRFDEADRCYAAIASSTADPVALTDPTDLHIASLVFRSRLGEAIELGVDLLARLGLAMPDDLVTGIVEGLDRVVRWVDEENPAEDRRPEVTDPRLLAVGKLIGRVSIPAYLADPPRYAWLSLECQRLWAVHGPAEALVSGTVAVPHVLIGAYGDYRRAYDLAQSLLACAETRGYERARPHVALGLSVCDHWRNPVENGGALARGAREGLLHLGQLQYAMLTYPGSIITALESATHLDTVVEEVEGAVAFADRSGNDHTSTGLLVFRQWIRALRGETGVPGSLFDEEFDEATYRDAVEHSSGNAALWHCYRALAAAVFEDTAGLRQYAAAAMAMAHAAGGLYYAALIHLVAALATADRLRNESLDPAERDEVLTQLEASGDWLAARAQDAPANFTHLAHLVAAERAWAAGDSWAAAREFDTAQHLAAARSRPWHRALIVERAAAFHLAQGLGHTGYRLLAEARRLWLSWGAAGKVAHLDHAYPFLRTTHSVAAAGAGRGADSSGTGPRPSPGAGAGAVGHSLASAGGHSLVASAEALDLLGVLKASHALSTETNLDRLRERVGAVLTAMTGATGVHLALWNDETDDWHVRGPDGNGDTDQASGVLTVAEAGRRGVLPLSAFRYAERTREPLCVDDATRDDRFARDPYLAGLSVCSLLVVPILAHGNPRAMLVLENRLARGAFSADRLDAVLLIAGQLAVSLDNALAERFRSLVQRSADLTLVLDHRATITYASTAATDLLGADPTSLIGRPLAAVVHPDDHHVLDVIPGGSPHRRGEPTEPETHQCRLVHTDGTDRWAEATVTNLTGDAAVRGIMLHLRDITERHRLETELRHAQKLESIGQLSAGIAHEINTPIQFIHSNLTFLTGAFTDLATVLRPAHAGAAEPGNDDVDVEFLLDEIPQALADTIDGTTRVATIVRAMKALGRPGSDAKADADVNEAIRNTLVVAASEIHPVADVVTDLADLPPVWCAIGDINQVLLNLIVNAAHAIADKVRDSGERGTLTISTRRDGHDALIDVRDTGTGIPADIADRVFDQFFTTKPVGAGTGQGLALARTLIHDHHGGTLTFTTVPGDGTTFTIRIPSRPPEPVPELSEVGRRDGPLPGGAG